MRRFIEIGSPVPEKKIFEGFFTIYGHDDHVGHVTWITYIHINSHFLYMLHINLALIGQAVSEEKIF